LFVFGSVSVVELDLTGLMGKSGTSLNYSLLNKNSVTSWSQWPRGLRHELSSPARTPGSWVRIPLEAWMSVCVSVVLCIGSGVAMG
jgi:hypothetical protein